MPTAKRLRNRIHSVEWRATSFTIIHERSSNRSLFPAPDKAYIPQRAILLKDLTVQNGHFVKNESFCVMIRIDERFIPEAKN